MHRILISDAKKDNVLSCSSIHLIVSHTDPSQPQINHFFDEIAFRRFCKYIYYYLYIVDIFVIIVYVLELYIQLYSFYIRHYCIVLNQTIQVNCFESIVNDKVFFGDAWKCALNLTWGKILYYLVYERV